jgi:hypothetical protein
MGRPNMDALWLKDFGATAAAERAAAAAAGALVLQSVDGQFARAYLHAVTAPDGTWTLLIGLQSLHGASAGARPAFHYVVETDVAPEHERELTDWYEQEHLPGLAGVPGTIRAARYRRDAGSPRFLACYDLTSPATLERPEWLAVRHTAWSARVRPLFENTHRTMFRLPDHSHSIVAGGLLDTS